MSYYKGKQKRAALREQNGFPPALSLVWENDFTMALDALSDFENDKSSIRSAMSRLTMNMRNNHRIIVGVDFGTTFTGKNERAHLAMAFS